MYGSSAFNFHKLQMAQNSLTRTVTRSSISVPLSQLLSIFIGFQFTNELILQSPPEPMKSCPHLSPPTTYLHNLMSYQQPSLVLRSSVQLLLHAPRNKTEFGCCAFNSLLPSHKFGTVLSLTTRSQSPVHRFKRHLNTHYFLS